MMFPLNLIFMLQTVPGQIKPLPLELQLGLTPPTGLRPPPGLQPPSDLRPPSGLQPPRPGFNPQRPGPPGLLPLDRKK